MWSAAGDGKRARAALEKAREYLASWTTSKRELRDMLAAASRDTSHIEAEIDSVRDLSAAIDATRIAEA